MSYFYDENKFIHTLVRLTHVSGMFYISKMIVTGKEIYHIAHYTIFGVLSYIKWRGILYDKSYITLRRIQHKNCNNSICLRKSENIGIHIIPVPVHLNWLWMIFLFYYGNVYMAIKHRYATQFDTYFSYLLFLNMIIWHYILVFFVFFFQFMKHKNKCLYCRLWET